VKFTWRRSPPWPTKSGWRWWPTTWRTSIPPVSSANDVSFQAYLTSEAGQAQAVQPPYPAPQAAPIFGLPTRADGFHAGPLKQTGNVFDLAVNGKGLFSAESPEGTVTRAAAISP